MLVRFSVENFRSFRDRVELSMVKGEVDQHPDHVLAGTTPRDVPLLKLAVVYGANASGKSNLVRAMETARGIILQPAEAGRTIPVVPYKLDARFQDRPSRFEFEIKVHDRYFAYGFAASAQQVTEEWLYEADRETESCIFERADGGFRFPGLSFSNSEEEQFLQFTAKATLPNRLFLTECRERNVRANVPAAAVLFEVLGWFEHVLTILFPSSRLRTLALGVYRDEEFKERLAKYLGCFDTGIEGIDLEEMPFPEEIRQHVPDELTEDTIGVVEQPGNVQWLVERSREGGLRAWRLGARHSVRGGTRPAFFTMQEESDGTRRLADLAPALMRLLEGEHVFVIDEFDRSLHPEIAHSFLANFLRYSAGHPGQLIVTTHETTLLRQDFIRPDEVWFAEKTPDHASRLVSLAEYKLEGSKDLQQDYLQGRFGGVPVVRDFSWLGSHDGKGT